MLASSSIFKDFGMTKFIRNIVKASLFCCIFFLLSLSVGAESDSPLIRQYGLGNLDFESDSVGTTRYTVSSSNEYSTDRFGNKQGRHTSLTVAQMNGNKYLQFKDNGVPRLKPPYNPYWEIHTNNVLANDDGYYVDSFSTGTYDFFVVDFELAADAYLYTYTTESSDTDMTTDDTAIPNGAKIISKRPAYPEGLLIMNEISGIDSLGASSQQKRANRIKLVSEGDEWYLYAEQGGIFENTGARLKSKILEWNHFTVVVVICREDENLANSMQYTYLNGDFVAAQSIGDLTQHFVDFSNLRYGIEIPYEAANDDRLLYSFGLDSFSINYYMRSEDGSAYSSLGYGLDEYFKDGDLKKGIYNCEDAVYSNRYLSKDVVARVNGVNYHSMSEALSAVTENCTLELYRSLDNYVPTVDSLNVTIDDSLNFSLSPEADGYICQYSVSDGVKNYIIAYKVSVDEEEEEDSDMLLKSRVFDGAKYSLATVSNFVGNFYVKVPAEDSEYELYLGVGSGYDGLIYMDGVTYYKFSSEPLVTDITAKITFEIKVITSGATKTLTAEYTLDGYFAEAMAYLSGISEPNEYQIAQMRLIMNAVRYANELYKYVEDTETGYVKYEEILANENYCKNLISYNELDISENAESDFSEISSVVAGAGLVVSNGYRVSYALCVKEELANAGSIRVAYRSKTGEIKENTQNSIVIKDGEDSGYCYLFFADLPIYEMLSLQIITVRGENGEMLTGKHTLAAYIKMQENSRTAALSKAVYAYAKSSYQYKISSEQ